MPAIACRRCLASWRPPASLLPSVRGITSSSSDPPKSRHLALSGRESMKRCSRRGHSISRLTTDWRQVYCSSSTLLAHEARYITGSAVRASPDLQNAQASSNQQHDAHVSTQPSSSSQSSTDLIETYLEKRSIDPNFLATVAEEDLLAICRSAVRGSLGSVLKNLLEDTYALSTSRNVEVLRRQCLTFQAIMTSALTLGKARVNDEQDYADCALERSTVDAIATQWNKAATMLRKGLPEQNPKEISAVVAGRLSERAQVWMLRTITLNHKYDRSDLAVALLNRCLSQHEGLATRFPTARDVITTGQYFMSQSQQTGEEGTSQREDTPMETVGDILQACRQQGNNVVSDDILNQSRSEADAVVSGAGLQNMPDAERNPTETRIRLCFTLLNIALRSRDAVGFTRLRKGLPRMLEQSPLYAAKKDSMAPILAAQLATKLRSLLRASSDTQDGRTTCFDLVRSSMMLLQRRTPGLVDRAWLQAYCKSAFDQGDAASAVRMVVFLGSPKHFGPCTLAALEPKILMSVLSELKRQRKGSDVCELCRNTGLLVDKDVPSSRFDSFFPVQMRSNLLVLLSHCGMLDVAGDLYSRWTPQDVSQDEYSPSKMFSTLEEFFAADPPASQIARNRTMVPSDTNTHLAQSSQVLVALTRAPDTVRRTSKSFEPSLRLATRVLMAYIDARGTVANLDLADIALLAKSLSRLATYTSPELRETAILCIRIGFDKAISGNDIGLKRLMLRTLAQIDLSACCQHLRGLKGRGKLIRDLGIEGLSPILVQCIESRQFDLAAEVWDLIDRYRLDLSEGPALLRGLLVWSLQEFAVDSSKATAPSGREAFTDFLPRSSREVAQTVKRLIESGELIPNSEIMNCLVQTAFRAIQTNRPERQGQTSKTSGLSELQHADNKHAAPGEPKVNSEISRKFVENRKAAITLLDLCATHYHEVFGHTVGVALSQLQAVALSAGHYVAKQQQFTAETIKDVDYAVGIIRWVPRIRTRQFSASSSRLDDSEDEGIPALADRGAEGQSGNSATQDLRQDMHDVLEAAQTTLARLQPNKISMVHFRHLYVTYLRLGDALGAAQVLDWMKEYHDNPMRVLAASWDKVNNQKKKSFDRFIRDSMQSNRRLFTNQSEALAWAQGKLPVPRTKPWWQPPQ